MKGRFFPDGCFFISSFSITKHKVAIHFVKRGNWKWKISTSLIGRLNDLHAGRLFKWNSANWNPSTADHVYKIGLAQIIEHTLWIRFVKVCLQSLRVLGYKDGENIQGRCQSAQGNNQHLIQSMRRLSPVIIRDLIVAIPTTSGSGPVCRKFRWSSAVSDPVESRFKSLIQISRMRILPVPVMRFRLLRFLIWHGPSILN